MKNELEAENIVLIVDDDDNNLQLTAKAVHSAGYQIILAKDGESALKIIETRIPDAILLDIMMPGIDGLSVCRIMKSNPAMHDTPIIFLSAAGEEEKLEEGLECGGVDFVSKPVSNRVLLARLRSHLERGQLQKCLNKTNNELQIKNLQLAESEAFLRSILEGSPMAQYVINKSHKIISWNRAMETYSGILSTEIIGTDRQWSAFYSEPRPCLADILLDGKSDVLKEFYNGSLKQSELSEGIFEMTGLFSGKKGLNTWLFCSASPIINNEGSVIGAVETIIDISDQKKAEYSLKQIVQKLHLLSGITRHDILNKITALIGYLTLIREQIPESESKEYIDRSREIIDIIRSLITFTRDYQEIGIHLPEWQNLRDIFLKSQNSLNTDKVQIHNQIENIEIYADPLIERVFYNLLENSFRHGVNLTTIYIKVEYREGNSCIIYEDDGGGIPKSEKENIFLRKYYKNSGFGLFLSREIVQITGYTIIERGEEGSGVRFEITVPEGYYRKSF